MEENVMLAIAGAFVGLGVCLLLLALVLPLYAGGGLFVNKPLGLQKSGFHLFTYLEPGQVKVIERGQKMIRMVTNTAGKRFKRVGEKDSPEYWELVDGKTADPTEDVTFLLRWWARFVYKNTGLVFTGIWPFQRVREYELERTVIKRKEDKPQEEVQSQERPRGYTNLELIVKHDISDHFRTREFLFPMHITAAETKDKIPLDIIGVAEMAVVNTYKAAYGTDRWDQKVINLVTDAITSKTKSMSLDEALTATTTARARGLQKTIEGIREDTEVAGIQINGFKILEINPVLTAEGLRDIQAEAIAQQRAKATRIDGEARADVLRQLNEANAAGGENAVVTMEAEMLVRAAEAAGKGGGSVILMPGNSRANVDPVQTAILTELKKLNERGGKAS